MQKQKQHNRPLSETISNQKTGGIKPPRSASSAWFTSLVAIGFLIAFFTIWPHDWDGTTQAWLGIAVFFVPIMLFDFFVLKVHRRESTELDWDNPQKRDINRVAKRWLGMVWVMLGVALYYWLFPEYRDGFYVPYFRALPIMGFVLAVLSWPYFWWLDAYYKKNDGYIEMAEFMLGKFRNRNKELLKNLALGWLIKAFFLPLMYVYTANSFEAIAPKINFIGEASIFTFQVLFDLSFIIDLMVVSVGYMYTLRLADTHIRSSEPTFFGWAIAIVCYKPFWGFFYDNFVMYNNHNGWEEWFTDSPNMMFVWGCAILLLHIIYSWSSVLFGLRFSNLTYRGLVSSGPYRLTRHPAYLSKNLTWWMMSAPFVIAAPSGEALRQCAALLLNNLIYYWRAKTEEAHLLNYPEYREYHSWMSKHGMITKRLEKLFSRVGLKN